jgi:hypothetical protein
LHLIGGKPPGPLEKKDTTYPAIFRENESIQLMILPEIGRRIHSDLAWSGYAIPSLLFLVTTLLVPESPRWLATRGRAQQAFRVLERLGGPSYAYPIGRAPFTGFLGISGRSPSSASEYMQMRVIVGGAGSLS